MSSYRKTWKSKKWARTVKLSKVSCFPKVIVKRNESQLWTSLEWHVEGLEIILLLSHDRISTKHKAHIRGGQKCPQNNHLTIFINVGSKSLIWSIFKMLAKSICPLLNCGLKKQIWVLES